MICVQAEGCAPIPKALQEGEGTSKMWPDAHTLAAGLRVPKAYGDFIILDIVRKSGGTAIAVSDDAIMAAVKEMASGRGNFSSSRRWRCAGCLSTTAGERVPDSERSRRSVQHRLGLQVSRRVLEVLGCGSVRAAVELAGIEEHWGNY